MYTATLIALGLASSALAASNNRHAGDRLNARSSRRSAGRTGRLNQRVPGQTNGQEDAAEVSTSTNWSGAVLEGTNWDTVSATITMPTPKAPSGGSSSKTYSASAWVGIDGDSCQSALWQTGVDFNVKGGKVSYDAWWEWIPDNAHFFSGISFKAGDKVSMSVTAHTKRTGTAVIHNETTGKKVTKSTTGSASLCLKDAEWIVEDFEEGGSLVPLANWGSIVFKNATATTTSGAKKGPEGADIIQLKSGGKIVTKTTVTANSVTDKYT